MQVTSIFEPFTKGAPFDITSMAPWISNGAPLKENPFDFRGLILNHVNYRPMSGQGCIESYW